MRRQQTGVLVVGVLALAVLTVWTQLVGWPEKGYDVRVYWESAVRMRHGGDSLYQPTVDPLRPDHLYIYPPLFVSLFAPITLLPRALGHAVWGGLQFVFLGAAGWAVVRMSRPARALELAAVLLVALYSAVFANFLEGQINLLLVALVAAGLLLVNARPLLGGGLLGVAAMLKILPLALLGVLVAQGRRRAVAGMFAGLALAWAVPLVWTVPAAGPVGGFEANVALSRAWIETIAQPRVRAQTAHQIGGPAAPNHALSAVSRRYFGSGERVSRRTRGRSPLVVALPERLVRWLGLPVALVLYAVSLALAWELRSVRGEEAFHAVAVPCGLALVAAALGNLLFWPHHLCLLALILGPLWVRSGSAPRLRGWVVAILVVLAVSTSLPLLARPRWVECVSVWGLPTAAVLLVWGVTALAFWPRHPATPGASPREARPSSSPGAS